MDENMSDVSLEEIQHCHWNVRALKDFLGIRGLKTSGRKAELQALVYGAVQLVYDSSCGDRSPSLLQLLGPISRNSSLLTMRRGVCDASQP